VLASWTKSEHWKAGPPMGKSEDQDYAAQAAEMQLDCIRQDFDGDIEAYAAGQPPKNMKHIPERKVINHVQESHEEECAGPNMSDGADW